jgi:putative transposase
MSVVTRRTRSTRPPSLRHGFSESSYFLWRSKFGGMSVSDAKRLKELETENSRLKKLLAESLLENEVTREVLRKKW